MLLPELSVSLQPLYANKDRTKLQQYQIKSNKSKFSKHTSKVYASTEAYIIIITSDEEDGSRPSMAPVSEK